jgi:hypothetical protein
MLNDLCRFFFAFKLVKLHIFSLFFQEAITSSGLLDFEFNRSIMDMLKEKLFGGKKNE